MDSVGEGNLQITRVLPRDGKKLPTDHLGKWNSHAVTQTGLLPPTCWQPARRRPGSLTQLLLAEAGLETCSAICCLSLAFDSHLHSFISPHHLEVVRTLKVTEVWFDKRLFVCKWWQPSDMLGTAKIPAR